MNAIELKKVAKKLKINNFLGVFAVDELISLPKGICGTLIFNTDTSENQGQHWIALCISKKNVYYFDSLNLHFVFVSQIYKFLNDLNKDLFYNRIKTQTNNSTTCGIHCIVFCYHMTNSKTISRKCFDQFLSSFKHLAINKREQLMVKKYSILMKK